MSRKSPDSLSERDRRELTALADGSLTGRRRRAAEARIAGSPKLRAGLERQRRAVAALTGAEVAVPASLRARVRGAVEEPPKKRTPWLAWAGGAAVAIAAVTVVTLIIAGGAETPTVGEAAQLSALSPTEPAPASSGGRAGVTHRECGGAELSELARRIRLARRGRTRRRARRPLRNHGLLRQGRATARLHNRLRRAARAARRRGLEDHRRRRVHDRSGRRADDGDLAARRPQLRALRRGRRRAHHGPACGLEGRGSRRLLIEYEGRTDDRARP